ncbi:uncharacterized protein LOC110691102 [Chenopodium quinoa]|uniref:uncharacterized protein LOC110691102 n=1 Tax=Chenopodium quinoa TaxID=63459 RepID=UPI000B782C50|nr:uncharacterized protein LOC110691102 [Chenopodium quinoa]
MDYDLSSSSKILGRQSTVGSCSSRLYYGRPPEGKAFVWEAQPGKPITPPPDDILPPLSPPPAVLSMNLPKPYFDVEDDEPKAKKWTSAWLVKKLKKTMQGHYNYKVVGIIPRKIIFYNERKHHHHEHEQRIFESQRYDHSESARYSSSSFASTLTSSSANSFRDDRSSSNVNNSLSTKALFRGKAFTCNPKGLSDIVVFLGKKS